MVRPDNVKTAISTGQGSRGSIHPAYLAYARDCGFRISACRASAPTDKGKVEAKVKLVGRLLQSIDIHPRTLKELQELTDQIITRKMHRLRCPATGMSVWESLRQEKEALRPLPVVMPEPFEVALTRKVRGDATVSFEGHTYSLPFRYTAHLIEIRGYPGLVRMFFQGECIASHPRGTKELLLINQEHYEGSSTARVQAPAPLGDTVKLLLDSVNIPVAKRAVSVYERLSQVAR